MEIDLYFKIIMPFKCIANVVSIIYDCLFVFCVYYFIHALVVLVLILFSNF